MSSVPLFIALQPDLALTQFLLDAKERTRNQVGDQLYLSDPPHLTLYLAYFADITAVQHHIQALADTLQPVVGNLHGWHVFENDVLTSRNTLTCQIDPAAIPQVRATQAAVIAALSPLRDVARTRERYAARLDQLSPERQQAVETVGFPFIGDDWQPHFSVGSILPGDWPLVWADLQSTPPSGAFSCPQLKLYQLEGVTPRLVDTFPLG